MDLPDNIYLWAAAIGCLCCVGGIVLFFVFGFLGGIFDIISGIFELALHFLSSGPVAWCGCLALFLVCGGCAALIFFILNTLSTCGTPEAVNFCKIFG